MKKAYTYNQLWNYVTFKLPNKNLKTIINGRNGATFKIYKNVIDLIFKTIMCEQQLFN